MNSTTIAAIAGLVTALAPIVGALMSYKLKKIELEQRSRKADAPVDQYSFISVSDNFLRLILACIVIFACTGVATALIGAIDNYFNEFATMYFEKDIAWLIGNGTVLVLAIRHAIFEK